MQDVSALPLHVLPVSYHVVDPDRSFGIVVGAAAVRGRVRHGIDRAWINDVRVLAALRVSGSSSATAAITPISVERILDIGIIERILILPDVPAFICEWSAADESETHLQWDCDLSTRGAALTAQTLQWHNDDRTITVRNADASSTATFQFSVPFDGCTIAEADAGGASIRVRFRIGGDDAPSCVRMHVFSQPTESAETSFRNAASLVKAAAGSMRRRMSQQLRMTSSSAAIDAALELNKQHIALFPDRHTIPTIVLSALAVGEYGTARRMIENDDVASAWFLFLLAQIHAWTGDTSFITAQWERARHAAHLATERVYAGDPPGEIDLRLNGLAGFAAIATDIGRAENATDINEFVARTRAAHAALLHDAHWLSALDPAARDIYVFTQGRVRDGVLRLERAANASAIDPSALIAPLVFGLLGVAPDASRGRIRMRVQPPEMWDSIELTNLRFGDNALTFSWTHDSRGHHTIRASQTDGGAPVRLILEPRLPAQRLLNATVDGQPATLDARFRDDRLTTPVQLVLDEERVVTLQVDR